MDTFEAIRRSAAALNAKVIGGTRPRSDPMELVGAAVERLELELTWLPPNDPALKGAHALFDSQIGAILGEDSGTSSERALLVAHEIGHVLIHGSASQCAEQDIDASQSTEAAPVGLQRVEDYGAQERRELQANVFAREFVLPRSFAQRLFIEDELSALQIAEQLDLPIALVRQQIFDAILLPWTEDVDDKDSTPPRPPRRDDAQDRSAAHRGAPFQLQAGPGTGKTRTLVKRIVSLLNEGVDASSILALTFSNRAAGELMERISAAAPEHAPQIWVGTLHAFGLDLIRRHYDLLELPADPRLFARSDAIAVLEEILPTLPLIHYRNLWDPALILKDVLGAISRAKDELVDAAGYLALAQNMLVEAQDAESRVAAQKCLEIAEIYERYEEAKSRHDAVDFGDLIMLPTRLLERNQAVRVATQLRHRHLLVDEYQDVNQASVRLVKAIAGDGKRLWVVGDARQSIYRFRGASSTNMAAFSREFVQAKADRLDVSYRATQQVIDAFSSIAPHMGASKGMLPLNLNADRGTGPIPTLSRFDDAEDESSGLAAAILELQSDGVPFRKQAVLCRANARLSEIAAELEARNIPVLHLGSLFERDEVRDLLALMNLAIDPFGDSLTRIATQPRYAIPLQDTYLARRAIRDSGKSARDFLPELVTIADISVQAVAGCKLLAGDFDALSRRNDPWDFLTTYLLDTTDIGRRLATAEATSDRMRNVAIWQFLNFLRDRPFVGHGHPIQLALDRVRQLVLLAEERDLRQVPASALHMDAVRLMTIHGSKGLEFEAVHIPGLTEQSFPAQYHGQRCPPPAGLISDVDGLSVSEEAKRSHQQEEECLLFVAMSRARTFLRMYQQRFSPGGRKRTPSKLLSKMPESSIRKIESPPTFQLPDGALRLPAVDVTYPDDWSLTDQRLELYQKCPRRFFYTHVLGLGSARKKTAFSQTHDCIYEIIGLLAEERVKGEPTTVGAETTFDRIWEDRGPKDHAFAEDYRSLATRLISNLVESGAGRRFRASEPLAIDLSSGRVMVQPNELAELTDGTVILRRVRTGYRTQQEYDGLEYTLYHLAGEQHFSDGFSVEAVHLTDGIVEPANISSTKISNRRDIAAKMLTGIADGEFPVNVDAVTCPRCPHFFICPAVPEGKLTIS